MSFGPFRVKTVIFNQNRVHRVNTGQTMSAKVKNEFQAILGQNYYFWSKPGLPG
jgi:phosphotransferase system IIB component